MKGEIELKTRKSCGRKEKRICLYFVGDERLLDKELDGVRDLEASKQRREGIVSACSLGSKSCLDFLG